MLNKEFFRFLALILATVGAIALSAAPGVAAVIVGQTATSGAIVDGVRVPSGTTLVSPAHVETGSAPAIVHLSNGRVLAFSEKTDVVVASVEGEVSLEVSSGNVAYTDGAGEVRYLSASHSILLDQEGQIQEGARVSGSSSAEGTERICELQDWSDALWRACIGPDRENYDCAWEVLEVATSLAPDLVGNTAYLACKDRNPLDLDCDCNPGAFAWWVVPVGLAAGGSLYLLIDDDDELPASPTTP